MNKLISTITLLISFVSFGQTAEEYFQKSADKYEKRVSVFEIERKPTNLYFEGELFTGIVYDIFSNGNIKEVLKYKNGNLNGLWKEWHKNGNYKYWSNTKDGKINGLSRSWWENGVLFSETTYKNGKKNGYDKTFHSNGELMGAHYYYDGIIADGIFIMYHDDGHKMTEGNYKNGNETGLWRRWYDKEYNHQLSKEGNYKNGKKIGIWKEWYGNGQKKYDF